MVQILPYAPGDWAGIEAVHDAARMQELIYAGLPEAYLPLAVAAEREDLFGYTVCVARRNGDVVGFVAFTPEELAWLYVHPACQRQGIGRTLAEYALASMNAYEKSVEVLVGNEPARNLYRSLGFAKEELVHGRMPGNETFKVSVWQMTMEGKKND